MTRATQFGITIALAALAPLGAPAAHAGGCGAPTLQAPWRSFDAGDFPTFAPIAMDLGDLDGDGILDIVAAREFFGGPGLTVLMGCGDGSYSHEVVYELPFSHNLGDVDLADLDGDGDLDAVASVTGNAGTDFRVAVYWNEGDGTFGEPDFFITGEGPIGIVVADFTGDGFPDVLTADNGYVAGTNDTISLLRHNGQSGNSAGFMGPVAFTVGDNSQRIFAGDLDGDGDMDAVVGRGSFTLGNGHGISVVLNDGAGNFGPPTHYEQVPDAYIYSPAVALADMDNDGDLDLLAGGGTNGSPSYGVIGIRPNNGDGTFGAAQVHLAAPWTFTPHAIITGDLNHDGWQDVVLSTPSGRAGDGFNVILSDGKGGFAPAAKYEAAKQTFDLAIHDVDGDGDDDVLTVANDSSVITVHLNLGDGSFFVLPRNNIGVLTRDMVEGDINRDGRLDLVTGGDSDVHLLYNRGDGTFPPATPFDTPFSPGDILLADMNNDGWLDLVIRSYDFAVALSDQEGGFLPAVVTFVGATQAGEVGAFDLDNDGDLDIVATDPGPSSRVYLFRNNGNGVSYTFMNIIADFDGLPYGIGGGDLDHDGNIDLLFDNALGITVYLGNGDFTVGDPFPTSDYGYPFIMHDIDGDGELDISYKRHEPSFGTTEVAVMMGFGDGGFSFPDIMPGPTGREGAFRVTSDVDVGDVTGDGLPDVVFTNNAPNDICLFAGLGGGALLDQDRYGAGYSASDSAIGDFDGDGLNDVAVVISLPPSGLSDAVVILRNISGDIVTGDANGDGVVNFQDLVAILAAWGPCGPVCPEDLDGDGSVTFLDILIVLANWS